MEILNLQRKALRTALILITLLSLGAPPRAGIGDALAGIQQSPLAPVSPSAIGGAFSSLSGESFKTDLATGAATLSIPIVVPPGRKNVQPNLSLSYSSNSSNGLCGVGWSVPAPAIQRSTKKGVPNYAEAGDFTAGGEELINIGGDEYRSKIESSFTKYTYVSDNNKWLAHDKTGTEYTFGSIDSSRMTRPDSPDRVFAWYIDKAADVYGNAITYEYEKQDNFVYLKYVYYTENSVSNPALSADKKVEFVYESSERPDKIYSNNAGWPVIMKKRLQKIRIYIDSNKNSIWEAGEIVWTYNLTYILSPDTSRSLLSAIQLEDGQGNTLPAKTFTYQRLD